MSFYTNMNTVLNKEKTLTENCATAYATSGQKLTDFNFGITALRNKTEDQIKKAYTPVYFEDPMLAIKYMFYAGDVREGLGERKTFRACFDWLVENKPEIAKALIELLPEYTRWDNVCRLVETDLCDYAIKVIDEQLVSDIKAERNGESVSLLAKWLPSINASSPHTKKLGRIIADKLGVSEKYYRQILSRLRKYLDVVEVKMSSKRWDEIKYENVPSKANLNYSKAFLRNDPERRQEYLDSLANGETKINASVLQPHEIIRNYFTTQVYGWGRKLRSVDATLEALWKALPNLSAKNALVVRDGSGSMTSGDCGGCSRLEVATALAIYIAEHNSGGWKNKFVTFSASPKIVDLCNCDTLRDKIELAMAEADCTNTNIYATMQLILDTAIKYKITQEEMPETIIIISDMQFDGRGMNFEKSFFDDIADEYKQFGYKLPRICFWNLCGYMSNTIPMQQNELGLILCSGFSVQTMNMFMSGKLDPYELLVETLNGERYKPIEKVVQSLV